MLRFNLCAFADEADAALDGQIDALQANGIGLIELRGVDGKNVTLLTPAEVRTVHSRLDGAGIAVWSVGSPIGKVKISSDRSAEYDRFRRILETAVTLGASRIRLFSFYGTDGSAACRDEVCRRLDDMAAAAEGTGVRLCHENEKGIYGDTAERCAELLETLPRIGGIFDPANFIQCGVDVPEAWRTLRGRIDYVHIKDALPDGRVVPAGRGLGHIPELLHEFDAAGIQVLTLEPHLKVFDGLSALEGVERSRVGDGDYRFPDGRTAFDFAVASLRECMEKGKGE